MPADTEFAVIEIGMNHPGEIAPLARLARLDVAIITTVAPAHLEAFESIEGIAREKASIFEGLVPGGTAILPADIATTPILAASRRGSRVVRHPVWCRRKADWRLGDIQLSPDATVVRASAGGRAASLQGAHARPPLRAQRACGSGGRLGTRRSI